MTLSPTQSARVGEIKGYLVNQGVSFLKLSIEGSPQYRALQWMAFEDGLQLAVPEGDKTTDDGYEFITRFALTVLYYSTNGDNWLFSLDFLQPFSVCLWYNVILFEGQGTQEFKGVSCDDNNQVVRALLMSKYTSRSQFMLLAVSNHHKTTCIYRPERS